MAATRTVGISRLVMYRRERAVMRFEPRDKGIVLWTLRYGDEVRDQAAYFRNDQGGQGRSAVNVACPTIDRRADEALDAVDGERSGTGQAARSDCCEKKGRTRPAKSQAGGGRSAPSNVINIMDALKKSLAAASENKS